jgi:uroporphyrinogen decarboxylase
MLEIQGAFNARITERVLRQVRVDAAVFGEPIGDNNGPLISPRTYRELVLPTYQPVFEVLRRYGVQTIILRAYANIYPLIPDLLNAGINCLWVVEVRAPAMDYRRLRAEFGRDLRLIGGLDLDVLREGREAIRRELEEKVPLLLEQGGYAPLLDGRVREDVPWENYCYYRDLLQRLCTGGGQ